MFTVNACVFLLGMAVSMRALPRNEWLSASVVVYMLLFAAMWGQPSAVEAFGGHRDFTVGEKGFWVWALVCFWLCVHQMWVEFKQSRVPAPRPHPEPGTPDHLAWANREGAHAEAGPEDAPGAAPPP